MSSSTSHHSTPVTVSGYTEVDNPKSVDIKYMTEAVFVGKWQGREHRGSNPLGQGISKQEKRDSCSKGGKNTSALLNPREVCKWRSYLLCTFRDLNFLFCRENPNYTRRHGGNKHILVSQRSQSVKAAYCVIPTGTLWKGKSIDNVERLMIGAGGSGGEGTGWAQGIFRAVKLCFTIL